MVVQLVVVQPSHPHSVELDFLARLVVLSLLLLLLLLLFHPALRTLLSGSFPLPTSSPVPPFPPVPSTPPFPPVPLSPSPLSPSPSPCPSFLSSVTNLSFSSNLSLNLHLIPTRCPPLLFPLQRALLAQLFVGVLQSRFLVVAELIQEPTATFAELAEEKMVVVGSMVFL